MHAVVFPWKFDPTLDLGIALPLSWALMQDVTMRTTARLVVPGWDAGYGDLYQYGFPFAFTRWGTSSSEIDVFFLLPLVLDLLFYFLLVSLLIRFLQPLWKRTTVFYWMLVVVACGWMLLNVEDVFWGVVGGPVHLVEPYQVVSIQDPQFSWRQGNNMDGSGP